MAQHVLITILMIDRDKKIVEKFKCMHLKNFVNYADKDPKRE